MVDVARGLLDSLRITLLGSEMKLEVGVRRAVISADLETGPQKNLQAKILTKSGFAVVNVSRLVQLWKVDAGPGLLTVSAKVDVILLDEMY